MMDLLTLIKPHTHRDVGYPAGQDLDIAAMGMSRRDAEWLVAEKVATWKPNITENTDGLNEAGAGGGEDLQATDAPEEPQLQATDAPSRQGRHKSNRLTNAREADDATSL